MKYANTTTVKPEKSRSEIEAILTRYGASGFMYAWDERGALIGFMLKGLQFRILMDGLKREDFDKGKNGRKMSKSQGDAAFQKAERQSWRALGLIVKAKLEAIESNIRGITIETEFLPWMVLPNGQTAGEWLTPQIRALGESGSMKFLPKSKPKSNNNEVQNFLGEVVE